eukprot:6184678-Amphidinium_carterae.1
MPCSCSTGQRLYSVVKFKCLLSHGPGAHGDIDSTLDAGLTLDEVLVKVQGVVFGETQGFRQHPPRCYNVHEFERYWVAGRNSVGK